MTRNMMNETLGVRAALRRNWRRLTPAQQEEIRLFTVKVLTGLCLIAAGAIGILLITA